MVSMDWLLRHRRTKVAATQIGRFLTTSGYCPLLYQSWSLFGWISFSSVLLWLVFFIATGEQFMIVRWVSYVAPWLAMGLLLLIVIMSRFRKKLLMIAMSALVILISLPYIHTFLPSQVDVAHGQAVYKVMTFSKMGRNHDIDAVVRVIAAEKPDILFLQEVSVTGAGMLMSKLKNLYGDRLSFLIDNHAGMILSRFRLNSGDDAVSADIELPEGNIRVWNVHLQKSMSSTGIQYKAVDQLADQVGRANGPVLVAGDFNATVINYPYVKMKQYLNNAFEQAGFGFGFTFPSPARRMGLITPFMRIDHIFYNSYFTVHKAYVVNDAGGSDHYPLVALLSLNQGGSQ